MEMEVAEMAYGVNRMMTWLCDLVLRPLSVLPLFWSLALFSILFGMIMLLAFARLSNQEALVVIKKRLQGGLLAVRLFQESPSVFLKVQGTILLDSLRYLRHTLKPLAFLLVPFVLILPQLHGRYGLRPLSPAETAVVTVRLGEGLGKETLAAATLTATEGMRVDSAPVRVVSRREVSWRIVAAGEGRYPLTLNIGGTELIREVVVGRRGSLVTALRTGDVVALLLNPGEPPLPRDSGVESIYVEYPEVEMGIIGFDTSWLLWFLLMSIGAGFLFKGVFGVEL